MSGEDYARLYDTPGVAPTYREARALPTETKRLWIEVIRHAVGMRKVRLAIDVGAGTGRFTRLLADALDARVLAVETSAGMASAREAIENDRVAFVLGVAEALPLRAGSADVILMSMVYHQLHTIDAAVAEMRRAVRPNGLVLLRTPTRETLAEFDWLRFFPKSLAIDTERMPAHGTVLAVFARAGFEYRGHTVVRQRVAANLADYAARVRSRAYTSLQALPDDVWQRRLTEFEAHCRSAPDRPVDEPINLFVFEAAVRDPCAPPRPSARRGGLGGWDVGDDVRA